MWRMNQVWKRSRRSAHWRMLGGAVALALLTLFAVPVRAQHLRGQQRNRAMRTRRSPPIRLAQAHR